MDTRRWGSTTQRRPPTGVRTCSTGRRKSWPNSSGLLECRWVRASAPQHLRDGSTQMAQIAAACPRCRREIAVHVGEHVGSHQLEWWESYHCDECGLRMAVDGAA